MPYSVTAVGAIVNKCNATWQTALLKQKIGNSLSTLLA